MSASAEPAERHVPGRAAPWHERVLAPLRDPRWHFHVDLVLAVAAALVVGFLSAILAFQWTPRYGLPAQFFGSVAALAALAQCLAIAWRRTRPAGSAAAVYAGALVHYLTGAPFLLTDVLVLVALYSVTLHTPPAQRWARWAGLGGALIGAGMLGFVLAGGPTLFGFGPEAYPWFNLRSWLSFTFSISALVLGTWAIALVRRVRAERLAALEERARNLEVERDQQSRLAASAERTRIAREMHDVVAHSLSVVIAQADGGRYAARSDPAAAERALETISTMGRDALTDMRRILGVLRAGGQEEAAAEGAPPVRPEPTLGNLADLVDHVRDSGPAVSLVRTGQERPLPPAVGLGVYRIAQEALTNVLKHAGPGARVTVAQHWGSELLRLTVDDDGRGAAAGSDGQGQGLLGMRERAALLGGSLTAGPRPGGGFRVRAEIPLPAQAAGATGAQTEAPGSHTRMAGAQTEATGPANTGDTRGPSPGEAPHGASPRLLSPGAPPPPAEPSAASPGPPERIH